MIKTESTPNPESGVIELSSSVESSQQMAQDSAHHGVEGLSGFSFVEATDAPEGVLSADQPEFSLESAETIQDNPLFHPSPADLTQQVGNIPMALCDEELLGELNKIPDRLAFKIGDVAELVDVKTYVLRYWETEFEILNPKKSKNNQRVYSRRDVENVMLIKKLLYRDRFSIEGARAALKQLRGQVKKERHLQTAQSRVENAIDRMHELQGEIQRIKKMF